jgi:hypothetical protein
MTNIEYIIYILIVNNISKYKNKITVYDIINESKNIKYGLYNFTPYMIYRICIYLKRLEIVYFIRDNNSIYIIPTIEEF